MTTSTGEGARRTLEWARSVVGDCPEFCRCSQADQVLAQHVLDVARAEADKIGRGPFAGAHLREILAWINRGSDTAEYRYYDAPVLGGQYLLEWIRDTRAARSARQEINDPLEIPLWCRVDAASRQAAMDVAAELYGPVDEYGTHPRHVVEICGHSANEIEEDGAIVNIWYDPSGGPRRTRRELLANRRLLSEPREFNFDRFRIFLATAPYKDNELSSTYYTTSWVLYTSHLGVQPNMPLQPLLDGIQAGYSGQKYTHYWILAERGSDLESLRRWLWAEGLVGDGRRF